MRDSEWPKRFKVGVVVGLMLCGAKIWFTVVGMYGAFSSIEHSAGQVTPEQLQGSLAIARFGNYAFLAGVGVLLLTVISALLYRARMKPEHRAP